MKDEDWKPLAHFTSLYSSSSTDRPFRTFYKGTFPEIQNGWNATAVHTQNFTKKTRDFMGNKNRTYNDESECARGESRQQRYFMHTDSTDWRLLCSADMIILFSSETTLTTRWHLRYMEWQHTAQTKTMKNGHPQTAEWSWPLSDDEFFVFFLEKGVLHTAEHTALVTSSIVKPPAFVHRYFPTPSPNQKTQSNK